MSWGLGLENPWWLLGLLPILALLWWVSREGGRRVRISTGRARLVRWIRAGLLVLLILALAGLTAWKKVDRLTVVFALDVSRSIDPEARRQAERLLARAAEELPPEDRAAVVAFGSEAMVDASPSPAWKGGRVLAAPDPDASDLESAFRLASGLFPPGHERRVVVLSDGIETRGSIEDALLGDPDPPDVVWIPLRSGSGPEILVEQLAAPERVQEGEPHRVRVVVRSSTDTQGTLRLWRGPTPVAASPVNLEAGRANVFTLEQTPTGGGGIALYRARIEAPTDTVAQNNQASALVQVTGQPRVLLVDENPKALEPLAVALEKAGVRADLSGPDGMPPGPLGLAAWDAVLFSDVPATSFSQAQLEAVQAYVEAFGGGFLMTGGPGSFGPGGYWRTPVEEILPVQMELKDRSYYPSLGIVLAIDKSGSMAGRGRVAKIELAKAAAVAVAEMMLARDRLGVIAFDSAAKWVVPLTSGDRVEEITSRIGTLRAGGGTDAYPALVEANEALAPAPVRVKHVLLLTDGHIASRDYQALMKEIRAGGITVSTVAVGSDADSATLEWIAELGEGRFYQARNVERLPRIFLREAFHVARSWISEEPFVPARRGNHPALVGLPLDRVPPLGGYVGASEKPAASHPLATPRGDPLLSLWRTGLGKTVAFTSDPKARWGTQWMGWEGYQPFWSRLVRWSLRDPAGSRTRLAVDHRQGRLHVAADLSDERGGFVNGAVVKGIVAGPEGSRQEVRLRQTGPGRYEAEVEATRPGPYLSAVYREDKPDAEGATAAAVVPYSDEFRGLGRHPAGLERLMAAGKARRLEALSQDGPDGGEPADSQLAGLFEHRGTGGRVRFDLLPWLLAAAACLLVLEVAARKLPSPVGLLETYRARSAAPGREEEMLSGLRAARGRADRRMETKLPEREIEPTLRPAAAPQEEAPSVPAGVPTSTSAEGEDAPRATEGEEELTARLLRAKRRRKS